MGNPCDDGVETGGLPPGSRWVHTVASDVQVILGCESSATPDELIAMFDTLAARLPPAPTVTDRLVLGAILQKLVMRLVSLSPQRTLITELCQAMSRDPVLDAITFRRVLVALRGALITPRVSSPHVARFLRVVRELYDRPSLRALDVAREMSVSVWHLTRLVKQQTGHGFNWHLNQVRTARAAELLLDPALSVKEISAVTGYASPSELDRHFRGFFGMSPSEFRARRRAAN